MTKNSNMIAAPKNTIGEFFEDVEDNLRSMRSDLDEALIYIDLIRGRLDIGEKMASDEPLRGINTCSSCQQAYEPSALCNDCDGNKPLGRRKKRG